MVQEFFKTGEGIEGEDEWSVKNVRIDIDSFLITESISEL